MIHRVKASPDKIKTIKKKNRLFDIRPSDRNYRVGDIIVYCEFEGEFTGKEIVREVTYHEEICEGLEEGYTLVLLGIYDKPGRKTRSNKKVVVEE